MNIIDLLLLLIILLGVFSGWRKGFIYGALDLAVLAVTVAATFYLYPYTASFFVNVLHTSGYWVQPVA